MAGEPAFGPDGGSLRGSTASVDVGDVTRDGRLDIAVGGGAVLTDTGDRSYILQNAGPSFPATPLFVPLGIGNPGPKLVTDAFPETWLSPAQRFTSEIRFVDLDGDGDLDVFVANHGQRNDIYINRNAQEPDLFRFNLFLADRSPAFYNSHHEWDREERRIRREGDGIEGFSDTIMDNTLLGQGIMELHRPTLADTPKYPPVINADGGEDTRSVAFGDVNRNGRIDVFLANGILNFGAQNVLLMNRLPNPNRPNEFQLIDETDERMPQVELDPGVSGTQFDDTWSAAFVDVNNNGHLDLILGNSSGAGESVGPDLVRRSQLLLNDGEGHFTTVQDASVWPTIERPVTRVTVANFGRKGDFTEDIDGDGIVTDRERQIFDSMVRVLQERVFLDEEVPVHDVPEEHWSIPVTEVVSDPSAPARTYVTQRPPRFINLTGNTDEAGEPVYEPVWDVILWTGDGFPVYLSNDGSGNFSNISGIVFTDPVFHAVFDASVADVTQNGFLDLVAGVRADGREPSTRLLVNTGSPGFPQFADRTASEMPLSISTAATEGMAGDPRGVARAVALFDAHGDGDFDLYVGESGRPVGFMSRGALDVFYENRLVGAGPNARTNLNILTGAAQQPLIRRDLAITGVLPNFGRQGQELDVRLLGRRFEPNAEVFFGQGIELLHQPIVRSSELIQVRIRIRENAQIGPRQIFVFNRSGDSAVSKPNAFAVALPQSEADEGKDDQPRDEDATGLDGWELFH